MSCDVNHIDVNIEYNVLLSVGTCPALVSIAHGNVNATNSNKYGSVVQYVCDEGYKIDVGVPRTFCESNQTWRHADVFSRTNCTSMSTPFHYPAICTLSCGCLSLTVLRPSIMFMGHISVFEHVKCQ